MHFKNTLCVPLMTQEEKGKFTRPQADTRIFANISLESGVQEIHVKVPRNMFPPHETHAAKKYATSTDYMCVCMYIYIHSFFYTRNVLIYAPT